MPSNPGIPLSGTTGIVTLPRRDSPSSFLIPMGNVMSCLASLGCVPTPWTRSGLVLSVTVGFQPRRPHALDTDRAQASPVRFPIEPMSTSRPGLPEASSVDCRYARCTAGSPTQQHGLLDISVVNCPKLCVSVGPATSSQGSELTGVGLTPTGISPTLSCSVAGPSSGSAGSVVVGVVCLVAGGLVPGRTLCRNVLRRIRSEEFDELRELVRRLASADCVRRAAMVRCTLGMRRLSKRLGTSMP